MSIKPIQTRYNNYRFRSRLEARWAVFFDALGLRWEYEPEGFDLGPEGYYLPDFKVYGQRALVWVEIKPFDSFDNQRKFRALLKGLGASGVMCFGEPSMLPITTLDYNGTTGDMIVGSGVFATDKYSPVFYCLSGSGPRGEVTRNDWVDADRLAAAVAAARAARFEFGESGGR